MNIKYIGYYDIPENFKENRHFVLSATNKMRYIIQAFERFGYSVEVISASGTRNKTGCSGKEINIEKRSKLVLFPSIGRGSKLKNVFANLVANILYFWYLCLHISKHDIVLVYHSVAYYRIIQFLHKIKKFKLILEVEEIYGDVSGNKKTVHKELNYFQKADAFLFPTELLNEKLNKENKPYCIIYGTYEVEEDRKCKFDDGKTHAIYAGTFDPRKGGAIAAAAAAAELDFNYHIHILGFGNKNDTKNMKDLIGKLAKTCKSTVTYDGLKSGEEYIRFIQACDIGLSTQDPNAAFNNTSFPSKILSYMANGLKVVSVRIPAIEKAAIGNEIFYYNNQTPQEIAMAIKHAAQAPKKDSRKLIMELDNKFTEELNKLIEDLALTNY